MSQQSYQPAPVPSGGGAAQPAAAPTQVGFPGQAPYAQPQFAPAPQQRPVQQLASGFPNYVSPPPSPPNRTSLIVGSVVVVLVFLFAVAGFAIVA